MAVLIMKRFRFPLQQVLKLHEQRKRQAELRQQQVQVELQLACAQVAAIEDQLSQATAGIPWQRDRVSALGVWMNCSQYAVHVNDALNAAQEKANQVEQRLHEADRDRVTATTQTESVRHLRATQWAEHCQEEAYRAQQEMDEGALRRWNKDSKNKLPNDTSSSL